MSEYALEENYWIHIELFPGTAFQLSSKALNDLQVVFLNAHAGKIFLFLPMYPGPTQYLDAPTSETLAFPYTVKECEDFIDILECSQGEFC